MRYALVLEYDGREFHGWQQQPAARTVQGCLEAALSQVAAQPVSTVCAGRTDAGVHASAQVVHFECDAVRTVDAWRRGVNAHLPASVAVTWAGVVSDDFHARFSATERTYRYLIVNRRARSALYAGRAWCVHRPLALGPMREAAARLPGERDFSAFRAASCQAATPMRFVSRVEIDAAGDLVAIEISANAFLHNMVRILVGVLVAIGSGTHEPDWVDELLQSRDRTRSGVTAPAHGLCLCGVRYRAPHCIPSMP